MLVSMATLLSDRLEEDTANSQAIGTLSGKQVTILFSSSLLLTQVMYLALKELIREVVLLLEAVLTVHWVFLDQVSTRR